MTLNGINVSPHCINAYLLKGFFSIFSIKIYAILGHYVRSLKHKIITTLQMQFCISSEFMDKL